MAPEAETQDGGSMYPMLEVARHTTRRDCWMVIEGKVYDVTKFLEEHPGGEDILVDSSGRDATREFEDVGHSDEARTQLEPLLVGTLRAATVEELADAKESELERAVTGEPSGGKFAGLAKWLVPVVLVVVAWVIRKYV